MAKKTLSFLFLICSDLLGVLLCFYLAFLIRSDILPQIFPSLLQRPVFFGAFVKQAYMLGLWVLVFFYEKTYTKRYTLWEETRLIIKSTSIAFGFVMIIVFATQQYFEFSRVIIVLAWFFSLVLVSLT